MDENVGRVMAAARPNTLFIFAGDNGRFNNAPLAGKKYDIKEGGVRVPFYLRWDGHVPARLVEGTPVSLVDVAATLVAAAGGAPLAQTDGFNLLTGLAPTRPVFLDAMYSNPDSAVRSGPWKLYLGSGTANVRLYDLVTDIGETRNVAAANPAVVAKLSAQVQGFRAALSN